MKSLAIASILFVSTVVGTAHAQTTQPAPSPQPGQATPSTATPNAPIPNPDGQKPNDVPKSAQ